ncbi:threonine synthase [Euzebya tangerina]|uniref:threonine synthase n=1 Tax=Euzebya tangerina TaxID=591198 RepID=UPI00196B9EA6|nr:threonine synthase [Euzebya tangerina]
MESCLTHLEGSRTGATYDADVLQTLDPVDGLPLLARYDLARAARTLTRQNIAARRGNGMWRWRELLPVRDPATMIHLGEGSTPLLPAPRLGDALGLDRLMIKAEGQNPTGAFKARGMAAAVSRAVELGATRLIVPSAGNAGGALATYGAAAGVPVTIVLPVDTPTVNITEVQMAGAEVILVEGVISDCGTVARHVRERTGAFDLSTLKEPYRVEGKKTMGLELAEELNWTLPDVVVYPTGGGTGLIGMWKAFEELQALGLIGSHRPRMVVAQAAGCAPMVRAIEEGTAAARPWKDPATRASGLRVPSAVGDRLILSAVAQSGGTGVAVPESDIDRMQQLVAHRGAGYVSPESATAFAATAVLADEGWIAPDERVVVFDCGVGFKYPPPSLGALPVVDADSIDDPEAITAAVRGDRRTTRPIAARSVAARSVTAAQGTSRPPDTSVAALPQPPHRDLPALDLPAPPR